LKYLHHFDPVHLIKSLFIINVTKYKFAEKATAKATVNKTDRERERKGKGKYSKTLPNSDQTAITRMNQRMCRPTMLNT